MIKHLALYLDSPMQSWGYMSKFDQRTSYNFPTKSGVIGMVCAAMGLPKRNTGKLAEINKLKVTIYQLSNPFRTVDFHTVSGGFCKENPSERQNIVLTANGTVGNTVVTRREYLMDAKFGVVLSGDDLMVREINDAMLNPKWGVWLGRKSCIPASPLCHGIHATVEEAKKKIEGVWILIHSNNKPFNISKIMRDADSFEDGTESLMDNPEDFLERKFNIRRVTMS
jgi:CRISPR system Cascade subunit CasD